MSSFFLTPEQRPCAILCMNIPPKDEKRHKTAGLTHGAIMKDLMMKMCKMARVETRHTFWMDEVEYEERGIKMYRAFIVFPAAEYADKVAAIYQLCNRSDLSGLNQVCIAGPATSFCDTIVECDVYPHVSPGMVYDCLSRVGKVYRVEKRDMPKAITGYITYRIKFASVDTLYSAREYDMTSLEDPRGFRTSRLLSEGEVKTLGKDLHRQQILVHDTRHEIPPSSKDGTGYFFFRVGCDADAIRVEEFSVQYKDPTLLKVKLFDPLYLASKDFEADGGLRVTELPPHRQRYRRDIFDQLCAPRRDITKYHPRPAHPNPATPHPPQAKSGPSPSTAPTAGPKKRARDVGEGEEDKPRKKKKPRRRPKNKAEREEMMNAGVNANYQEEEEDYAYGAGYGEGYDLGEGEGMGMGGYDWEEDAGFGGLPAATDQETLENASANPKLDKIGRWLQTHPENESHYNHHNVG